MEGMYDIYKSPILVYCNLFQPIPLDESKAQALKKNGSRKENPKNPIPIRRIIAATLLV